MVVQKYGGTSVATIEKIGEIAKCVAQRIKHEQKMIVVVSAMSGETDALMNLGKTVSKNSQGREIDQLVSLGENKTSSLMALSLNNLGVKAVSLTGWQAGILTTNEFLSAKINKINFSKLKNYLKTNDVVVVAGFQGVTIDGDITTLGKGGSDTTALALSAVLGCECEVYTDVCGVYSADPRLVPNAKKIDFLTYDEMMEMSACGAKVMETRSIEIAKKFGVKLWVSQTLYDKRKGTLVGDMEEKLESACIKNVTTKDDVVYLKIECEKHQVNQIVCQLKNISQKLDMFEIKQKENVLEVCFLIEKKNLERFWESLQQTGQKNYNVVFEKTLCKITLVGSGFRTHSGILLDVLKVFEEENISCLSLSVSEVSLGFIVLPEQKIKTVEVLTKKFDLVNKKIKLGIVGATGKVGRAFLKVLSERDLKNRIEKLVLFASEKSLGKSIEFDGKEISVTVLTKENIVQENLNYVFFSAGEKVSKEYAKLFMDTGAVVIDNSSAFRMENNVPLVVPEVNAEKISGNLISNPNCSTIQVMLPISALKKNFGVDEIDYVTFQAVSGSGNKGVEDLNRTQNGNEPEFYPYKIYNNCLPEIGSFLENGYTTEEMKMVNESKKILNDTDLKISATCVRVPVENCHSIAVTVKLKKVVTKQQFLKVLAECENLVVFNGNKYPICEFANNQDKVLVGRIRQDLDDKYEWHFWCVADNIRKGASTNGVQILEYILNKNH